MARNTELEHTGLHLVKMSIYGSQARVSVPTPVVAQVNFVNGIFLGVMALGPCVVVARITDVSAEGATAEMARAIRQAYKEWEKQQAAVKK
jgi:hypothetical protein